MRLPHKNGEWRDYEVIYMNVLYTSSINGIVCILLDITEMIKHQNEIQYIVQPIPRSVQQTVEFPTNSPLTKLVGRILAYNS